MENQTNIQNNLRNAGTLALLMVSVALGTYVYTTLNDKGHLANNLPTITVNGEGEVLARPDIAMFTFSVRAEGADSATAQEESAEAMNEILAYLGAEGVEEKDIKTLYYNLNPRYDYVRSVCTEGGFCPPGERVLRGYEVNQSVQVKVRDIDEAGTLISGVGTRGATDISSLQFTIDDDDVFIAEARAKAIADAKKKAEQLAKDLDVKLVRILYFNENGGYPIAARAQTFGFGGEFTDEAAVAPELPVGENTFTSFVNITYEIK